VWSLCVVLYELVSGACPFKGVNYNVLMQSIIHDEPQHLESYGVFDTGLWTIVDKGLAKRPEDRWSSMRELGRAMAGLLLERGVDEDIVGRSLRRSWNIDGDQEAPRSGRLAREGGSSGQDPGRDESHLAAIAELNRGGDPALLLARAEQRRLGLLIAVMVVLLLGLVLSILSSTGYL
jgi:serine/threonine protein kinase